jgi:hypothetical protein
MTAMGGLGLISRQVRMWHSGVFLGTAMISAFMSPASAQVIFEGQEYTSMSEAITAVRGTNAPGYFSPERLEALGDVMTDFVAEVVGDNVGFRVGALSGSRAFGGPVGDAALGSGVSEVVRDVIQLARSRPDMRPRLEQLMDAAGVSPLDVDPEPYRNRGDRGVLEYEIALMEHVRQQLVLSNVAEYSAGIPSPWLFHQIADRRDALALLDDEVAASVVESPAPGPSPGPVTILEDDAGTTSWLARQFGVTAAEYWSVFASNGREGLGFLYYHIEGSAGNFALIVGHFRRDGNRYVFTEYVRDLFGSAPRDFEFGSDEILVTTTILAPGDARCCPTGTARNVVNRSTMTATQR